jgi:hypothetical protein
MMEKEAEQRGTALTNVNWNVNAIRESAAESDLIIDSKFKTI